MAEDLTPWAERRLRDFVEARLEAQRADLMVLHVTGWPRTGFLRAAFPDARVVNVVRDGRAVASSWLQMGWWDGWQGPDRWIYGPLPAELHALWEASGRSFAVLAGLGWRMLLEAAERARERLAGRLLVGPAVRGPARRPARTHRRGCWTTPASGGTTGSRPGGRGTR